MDTPKDINEAVATLARYRALATEHKKALDDAIGSYNQAILESERLQSMLEFIDKRRETIGGLEDVCAGLEKYIKDQALTSFITGGIKKPADGVEVKIFKVAHVDDERSAKVWCAQNAPDLLKLDMRGLAKAIENLQLDFASIVNDPRVQISSNLKDETGDKT